MNASPTLLPPPTPQASHETSQPRHSVGAHPAHQPNVRHMLGALALVGLFVWSVLAWQSVAAPWGGFFSPLGGLGMDGVSTTAAPLSPVPVWSAWMRHMASQTGQTGQTGPHGTPAAAGVGASTTAGGLAAQRVCTSNGRHSVNSDMVVNADEWVCGDVAAYNGNLTILGHVSGDAQALNGSVTISGMVDGSVTALHGDVRLLPGARVTGDVSAVGGAVYRDPQASVGGQIQQGFTFPRSFSSSFDFSNLGSLVFSLIFWICAALVVAGFFPERLGYVRYIARSHFWRSFFSGALVFVVSGVLGVLLVFTCIGIPVSLALGVAVWLAWVVGTLAIAAWVGDLVGHWLARLLRLGQRQSLLASTIFGSILLTGAKDIPCVGPTLGILIGGAGIGAAILALLSARKPGYSRVAW